MSFLGELRRRNVVRVGIAYLVVAWLVMQVIDVVNEPLSLPDWFDTVVILLLAIGLPIALLFSWAYELTPEGLKKSHEVDSTESITPVTGRKLDRVIIAVLVLVVVVLVLDNYVLEDPGQEAVVQETTLTVEPAAEGPAPTVQEEERDVLPNSVAVLLCDNLSPDPDDAYFAAGIHDEILNQLFKLGNLTPISRNAVLQYGNSPPPIPQVAEELRVESVMECSVRYAGDSVLVTAQLIDPETNLHLWSDTYEGDLSDVSTLFAIQADIAMNIANALEAEFTLEEQAAIERPPTDSTQAYTLYLRARELPRGTSIAAGGQERSIALDYLDQAIALDPEFALAYAAKATVTLALTGAAPGTPEGWIQRRLEFEAAAQEAAEKALEIDPDLGAAHTALAYIHLSNWREADARTALERAIELSPNDPGVLAFYGQLLASAGQREEAIRLTERAWELEPGRWRHTLGNFYQLVGDTEAAYMAYLQALEANPTSWVTHLELGRLETLLGEEAAGFERVQLAERLLPSNAAPRASAILAHAYALVGSSEDAMRLFTALETMAKDTFVEPVAWAYGYLAVRDRQNALRWIEEAGTSWTNNPQNVFYLKANVFGDSLLEEPEFVELREQLGFTDL